MIMLKAFEHSASGSYTVERISFAFYSFFFMIAMANKDLQLHLWKEDITSSPSISLLYIGGIQSSISNNLSNYTNVYEGSVLDGYWSE